MPLPVTNPDTTLSVTNKPWLVLRPSGAYNGRGGYSDSWSAVAVLFGRTRETRKEIDPTKTTERGVVAETRRIFVIDAPDADLKESDRLAEGEFDAGTGDYVEKADGERFEITNVRHYDHTTQANLKAFE